MGIDDVMDPFIDEYVLEHCNVCANRHDCNEIPCQDVVENARNAWRDRNLNPNLLIPDTIVRTRVWDEEADPF